MYKFIILSLLLCMACYGRIGETKAECSKRYGQPQLTVIVKADIEDSLWYKKNDIIIYCIFHEGVCQKISYRNYNNDLERIDFSIPEIVKLLEVNRVNKFNPDGVKFFDRKAPASDKFKVSFVAYKKENGINILLRAEIKGRFLEITTANYTKWLEDKAAAAKRDKLKGF